MATLLDHRREILERRLERLRKRGEAQPFQTFVLGLLSHDGYRDIRPSNPRSDFGRDGVGCTPDGKPCVICVSFDCSLAKIRSDAQRWTEDENREPAEVLLFVTNDAPVNTTTSKWTAEIRKDFDLELRIYNREAIQTAATRQGIWPWTRDELGIVGGRPGYTRISPYDGDAVRSALRARPSEWLKDRIDLQEWGDLLRARRSRLLFGKPGAGKTTTLFEMLEKARPETVLVVQGDLREASQIEALLCDAADGAVIVFDDLHENHENFVALADSLRRLEHANVTLWAATRSQEWEEIRSRVPSTIIEDLHLLGEGSVTLSNLDESACKRLIEICREEWDLRIEDRLVTRAARCAAERDATPLFVISVLAAAREDRCLRDEHLAGLPRHVRDLWARYWEGLGATAQATLRLIRLFWAADTPPQPVLLSAAASAFGLHFHEVEHELDYLARAMWITRSAGVPGCLDVQFEVTALDSVWLERWNRFVFGEQPGVASTTRLQLHIGTGNFYLSVLLPRARTNLEYGAILAAATDHIEAVSTYALSADQQGLSALALKNASSLYSARSRLETTREGRDSWLDKATEAVEESVDIHRELGRGGDLARSLNTASNRYSARAGLEGTREGRVSWLEKATEAVEESVGIYRELGVRGDLAMSLNNASNLYSARAGLEGTREGRVSWLEKATEAVEESVGIYRELGVRGDLANSLNNASNLYSARAGLETTRERRVSWLDKATKAVEESVGIYRELGVRGDLAMSLNNASNLYSDRAGLETTREGRVSWLDKATEAVEESIGIRRELGVRGDLAMSLGSLCQRKRAIAEVDPAAAADHLAEALQAIDEALPVFREVGESRYLLLSLQDCVITRLLLGRVDPGSMDQGALAELIEEGSSLAASLQDESAAEFFRQFREGS